MRLIQPVGSSVGKHKRRLTAMILTLSFAAAHVVSPAAEFAKAYAAENGQEVVLTEEAEPAGFSETPESPESSAPDEPVVSTPLAVTSGTTARQARKTGLSGKHTPPRQPPPRLTPHGT